MQGIAVGTESADGKALIIEQLFKFLQIFCAAEHRQLAVRIAGVVAGTELDRADVELLQLFKDFVERELRQQRGKYANSHGITVAPLGEIAKRQHIMLPCCLENGRNQLYTGLDPQGRTKP